MIDIATKHIKLVSPNLDPENVMWMGLPDSLETLVAKYDVDEAVYVDTLEATLAAAPIVYTLPIFTGASSTIAFSNDVQSKALHTAFAEARAFKADWEVEIIRKANKISSDAHVKVSFVK